MLPDDATAPFTVADVVHVVGTGVAPPILPFVLQLTVSVGAGIAATVTFVDPEPVAVPPVTVTFDVIVPAVGYVQVCVLLALETIVTPVPSQSHAKPVAAVGAPLSGVTVAVRVADPPAAIDVGEAASDTVYEGVAGGGASPIVMVALDTFVPDDDTEGT